MPNGIPLVVFEDEHLLVVNKPPGVNTHAPSPHAGEGIYDWLRNRKPHWANLAIIHRLDKETSGVMVFGKTSLANRSLTEQFTARTVRKKYFLLTDRPVPKTELTVKTSLVRTGEKYIARPATTGGNLAETRFRLLPSIAAQIHEEEKPARPLRVIEAEPLTGRTHQIRVHAAHQGFPILGDTLYGGTAARRVYLHAETITVKHPASDQELTFAVEAQFEGDRSLMLREALIDPGLTNAYRLIHGERDGWPGWYLDRLGDFLLSQGERTPDAAQSRKLADLLKHFSGRGVYHKTLTRRASATSQVGASPRHCFGETAPERFGIRENGLQFELSFAEGYSVGLFLDQRDNRRRLLNGYLSTGFSLPSPTAGNPKPEFSLLNTFAYTCGFSVCAAKAGARTTSLDLSKKYLEWGKRNFVLNGIDAASHEFIFGDVFDWLKRLDKKERRFEIILLDPPTFSQSKEYGVFRVEKNYGELVMAALRLLKPGGVLFASTNAADWAPEKFMATVEGAIHTAKKTVLQSHYVPQPLDFPSSRLEPAYLKTVWLRIGSKGSSKL